LKDGRKSGVDQLDQRLVETEQRVEYDENGGRQDVDVIFALDRVPCCPVAETSP
jgi:hypothetical protein